MYIHLLQGSYGFGTEDRILRTVRGDILPSMQQQPGFNGYLGGLHRTGNAFVGLAFWETRDQVRALNAPTGLLTPLLRSTVDDYYRVVMFPADFLHISVNGASTPSYLRVAVGSYDVANEAQLVKATARNFLPIANSFPGSLGIVSGVRQRQGKVLHVSVWQSPDQAEVLIPEADKYAPLLRFEPGSTYEIVAQSWTRS